MIRCVPISSILVLLAVAVSATGEPQGPADLIIHHAKVVTTDAEFHIVQAVAVKDGRILAVGDDESIIQLKGPRTRLIDADGHTVLPGLYDSHVHPVDAALSELREPLPVLKSLKDVFAHIRKQAAKTPEGEWIVVRFAFPTRLDEARFPTKAELDEAAPKHPVLYHAGPAGIVNSIGLKASGVTKDTPNPTGGVIVKDADGMPTGMLRNAYGVLRGLPKENAAAADDEKRAAVKKLFALYNARGLTSIADRNAGRDALDIYLSLRDQGELTLRVNVARSLSPYGTHEEVVRHLDELPGKDGKGGPSGVGDDWVRIGPIKMFLDGGMLNGTAFMRKPWPKGKTYQITEDDYRGLLFIPQEQLRLVVEEAAKRKWQVTAHTAGESAMDELLDAYEFVNRVVPIKNMRFCITHANFPSQRNLELCKQLGVCADIQPVWLWKDGTTLLNVLGKERMRWFHPYKTWLAYTTIGGGSDHMIKLDAWDATNPWDPWLGIAMALTRTTERGTDLGQEECLTREQAVRLYTINNAYLNHEEKAKGTLERGKLADLIVVDRDILTCPA
ncbi:MAG TPA: amidohydrolase family protein, partial [Gemmataceae bacterium]